MAKEIEKKILVIGDEWKKGASSELFTVKVIPTAQKKEPSESAQLMTKAFSHYQWFDRQLYLVLNSNIPFLMPIA